MVSALSFRRIGLTLALVVGVAVLFTSGYFGIPAYRAHRERQKDLGAWRARVMQLDAESANKPVTPTPH